MLYIFYINPDDAFRNMTKDQANNLLSDERYFWFRNWLRGNYRNDTAHTFLELQICE